MELRKLILATGLALVVMFALSSLWHGLLMREFYEAHTATLRDVPILRLVGLGYFVLALLMVVLYPKGYDGDSPLLEGLRFGALMGVLVTLPHGLVLYGSEGSHTGTLLLVDAVWHMFEQGAGGVAVGLVHGRQAGIRSEVDA